MIKEHQTSLEFARLLGAADARRPVGQVPSELAEDLEFAHRLANLNLGRSSQIQNRLRTRLEWQATLQDRMNRRSLNPPVVVWSPLPTPMSWIPGLVMVICLAFSALLYMPLFIPEGISQTPQTMEIIQNKIQLRNAPSVQTPTNTIPLQTRTGSPPEINPNLIPNQPGGAPQPVPTPLAP